jgi:hypothetical protein
MGCWWATCRWQIRRHRRRPSSSMGEWHCPNAGCNQSYRDNSQHRSAIILNICDDTVQLQGQHFLNLMWYSLSTGTL